MTPHSFSITPRAKISQTTIDEHLKLYAGYVTFATHTQSTLDQLALSALESTPEQKTTLYTHGEMARRYAFEHNGVRNHELYFLLLEGAPTELTPTSALYRAIETRWGSFEVWRETFITLATTRGIGWAFLSQDNHTGALIHHFVDEQHIGQLQDTTPLIALDMWEHAYVIDYLPSGKRAYAQDWLAHIDWSVAESRYTTHSN